VAALMSGLLLVGLQHVPGNGIWVTIGFLLMMPGAIISGQFLVDPWTGKTGGGSILIACFLFYWAFAYLGIVIGAWLRKRM
jgi:hypothetical protein